jgi:hypothetical protein
MRRAVLLLVASYATAVAVQVEENSSIRKEDIKQKALFKGKEYYDNRLHKKFEKNQAAKKEKDMKVYKRKDGTIDSWKTYNEARD